MLTDPETHEDITPDSFINETLRKIYEIKGVPWMIDTLKIKETVIRNLLRGTKSTIPLFAVDKIIDTIEILRREQMLADVSMTLPLYLPDEYVWAAMSKESHSPGKFQYMWNFYVEEPKYAFDPERWRAEGKEMKQEKYMMIPFDAQGYARALYKKTTKFTWDRMPNPDYVKIPPPYVGL